MSVALGGWVCFYIRMKRLIYCPNESCQYHKPEKGLRERFVKTGTFKRKFDGRRIQRFRCRSCGKRFSAATLSLNYRQHKPWLNHPVAKLFCSGMSERRLALYFKASRRTIVRKLLLMAQRAERKQEIFFDNRIGKLSLLHFDELETFEHTKCKPISVPLAVDGRTRHILAFDVASMPAKGKLAKIAQKRYGFRRDDRPFAIPSVLSRSAVLMVKGGTILTDMNPHYPKHVKAQLPHVIHAVTKGRRGCVVGQGELKRGGYDPLFSLNHSCAMFRANINRLFRRTWCTTKKMERLKAHIMLYVDYHNSFLVGA